MRDRTNRPEDLTAPGMTRNYTLALAILATLSIFAFFLLLLIINTQQTTAGTVNVSGRQRMLSQRIAMLSLRLSVTNDNDERSRLRRTLKGAIEDMESAHARLFEGDPKTGIAAPSENVSRLYEQPPNDLNKKVDLFLTKARRLADSEASLLDSDNPDLRFVIVAASDDLLVSFDRVVAEYQTESEATIGGLQILVVVLLVLTLLVLTAEAFLIFKPMVNKISEQTARLEESYERSQSIADTLQRALMPKDIPRIASIDFASIYRSATTEAMVGGDFFDFFQTENGNWVILLGDVAGHGIDTAAETARVKFLFRDRASGGGTPTEIISQLNLALLDQDVERFTAITYMSYDESRSVLTMVAGGNPYPYLSPADKFVEVAGIPVGVVPEAEYEAIEIELKPGETLFIYSDGLVEARIGSVLFGYERLQKSVAADPDRPLEEILLTLVETAKEFAGGNLQDDILILALRRKL